MFGNCQMIKELTRFKASEDVRRVKELVKC